MNNLPDKISAVNLPAARIETVIAQRKTIMQAIKEAMQVDVHYGKIPGCPKPTCYKSGAEMLSLLFGLRPQFQETISDLGGGHLEAIYTCSLYSPDGQIMGQGIGSCSTMESKYRYRNGAVKCPACGKETIIKGKKEYGGGWICFAKKGGCGAKYADGDHAIESQERGKIENLDIADQRNTVRKMAKKRSHIDAVLTTTGASEFFTQDIEDFPEYADYEDVKPAPVKAEIKTGDGSPAPVKPTAEKMSYHYYSMDLVPAEKMDMMHSWFQKAGAQWDDELKCYVSEKVLKAVAKAKLTDDQVKSRMLALKAEATGDPSIPEIIMSEDNPTWLESKEHVVSDEAAAKKLEELKKKRAA